jgi:two-component system, cell cycle response regulator
MSQADRDYLTAAAERIEAVIAGRSAAPLQPHGLTPELEPLAARLDRLLHDLSALRRFAIALGNGDLSQEPTPGIRLLDPLKPLHANLRHLTWQAQRVAAGDLSQRVDFLGDFSEAFNRMIQALRDKQLAEDRVRYLSEHDTLTGLHNRTYFEAELERLRTSGPYPVSFIIADLDGLKPINDSLGHRVGDLLIQKAAQVIQNGTGADGTLARIGGDEFVIVLSATDDAQAHAGIARIVAALDTFNRRSPEFPLSFSLGAGTASGPETLDAALRQADMAMYEDKDARKAADPTRTHR